MIDPDICCTEGVEEGDPPNEKVKFGQEVLYLDCWYKKLQYDWFCKVVII